MARTPKPIRTDTGYSTADSITVYGKNLCTDVLGKVNLGDMGFLGLIGRLPTAQESIVFNAIAVTLVEHGMTPSAIAARVTYVGAPESLQGAVAAGLLGLGSVFVGSMDAVANLLTRALKDAGDNPDYAALANTIVDDYAARKAIIPGIGHPIHKPVDPRVPVLFRIAAENGFSGRYVALMQAVHAEAQSRTSKVLPMNATSAIGAIACELGIDARVVRGLGVMARAVGLVSHILEEARNPMAAEIWHRVEDDATAHIAR